MTMTMTEQQIADFVIASRRAQGLADHVKADEPFEAVAAILITSEPSATNRTPGPQKAERSKELGCAAPTPTD